MQFTICNPLEKLVCETWCGALWWAVGQWGAHILSLHGGPVLFVSDSAIMIPTFFLTIDKYGENCTCTIKQLFTIHPQRSKAPVTPGLYDVVFTFGNNICPVLIVSHRLLDPHRRSWDIFTTFEAWFVFNFYSQMLFSQHMWYTYQQSFDSELLLDKVYSIHRKDFLFSMSKKYLRNCQLTSKPLKAKISASSIVWLCAVNLTCTCHFLFFY